LQLLQDLAGYSHGVPLNTNIDGTGSGENLQKPGPCSSRAFPNETAIATSVNGNQALIAQHHVNLEALPTQPKDAANQQYTESHPVPQKLKGPGSSAAELETTSTEVAMSRLLEKSFTVQDILEAGIKALSLQVVDKRSPEPSDASFRFPTTTTLQRIVKLQNPQQNFSNYLPNIYKNNLRVNQINLVAACAANLGSFGFTLDIISDEDANSCFFIENVNQDTSAPSKDYSLLKQDLRPTLAQFSHSHHPYIDCIPFPDFRERLVNMIAADPQLEYDFCEDLEKDGLICWGSALDSQINGVGSGAPWDMRSWEAQPWFIKKWWLLVGGPEGDMYKQSRWWCEMRGESSSYPW